MDVRRQGSGNIGATNVLRVLGKKYGYPVFAFDVFKGFAAAFAAPALGERLGASADQHELLGIIASVAVVLGHSFPVWLKFRGGKGVATSAGALLALTPVAALLSAALWIVVFYATRYVSVASIVAAAFLPMAIAVMLQLQHAQHRIVLYLATALATVVIVRHRANFARLRRGTEQRFERK